MEDVTGDSRAYVIARRRDSIFFFFWLLGAGAARRLLRCKHEMAKDQVAPQITVFMAKLNKKWNLALPLSFDFMVHKLSLSLRVVSRNGQVHSNHPPRSGSEGSHKLTLQLVYKRSVIFI